jgi:hypothetical protein
MVSGLLERGSTSTSTSTSVDRRIALVECLDGGLKSGIVVAVEYDVVISL